MRKPVRDWEDPEIVRQVETMAGLGLRTEDIAAVVGVSTRTIERHLLDAVQRGRSRATAQVAQTAYKMAVSGEVPAMTMFWLKCQGRWREKHEVEITDNRAKPIQVVEIARIEHDDDSAPDS